MSTQGIISLIECVVCTEVFQISGRICWNPARQAGCAGMHVNNTQKAEVEKKTVFILFYYTHIDSHSLPAVLDKRLSAL